MPMYEYRCGECEGGTSAYLRTYSSPEPTACRHCGSGEIARVMSTFAYHKSEADKMAQLDPKYGKMVDDAMSKAPPDTYPDHYLNKMAPFSAAKEKGDPYFKE